MAKFKIVMKSADRTVIAAAGGGQYSSPTEKTHTDAHVKATITADHVAYEGGFVILYNESPYDPIFVASRDTLHAIYRLEDNA